MGGEVSGGRTEFNSYYESILGGRVFRWLDWAKVGLLRRVLDEVRPGRVLDLGCGSGGVSGAVRRGASATTIIGLDHDHALVRAATRRGLSGVIADFDRTLPFRTASFEGVVMVDTIEHTDSPRAIVAEAKRVLSDEGVFVVFTPPYDRALWVLAESAHRLLTGRPADHIAPFTRESLLYLLGREFSSVRIGYLNLGLTMYAVARLKKGVTTAATSAPK